jgi:DNA mismatch repair protein MutS2
LKYLDPAFENASVEFDEAKLAPTYRLLWGIPGRSNALNIASRLGLDADVIEDARRRAGTASVEATQLIQDMEIAQKRSHSAEQDTVRVS